jgi:hypothetical protein
MMKSSAEVESLTRRVAALWEEAMDQDLANSENVSFEAFLGAQYSIAALAKQCTITEEGIKIIELSFNELVQLGENEEEDDDE